VCGALLENRLDHARITDRLADDGAISDEAFCARLHASVTIDFHHRSKDGRRALLADPNQFLRERAHFPPAAS
jgi:hypothetical protein